MYYMTNSAFLIKIVYIKKIDSIILLLLLYSKVRGSGIERELVSRADQRLLRWFGDVERMDENRMA